jgi:predicted permease
VAKKQKNKDDERSMDMDHLEPAMKKKAHDLGFRKRVSINKVLRGIEHEKWAYRLCLGFVIAMAISAVVALVLRFFLPEERQGHFLMIGLFAAFWSLGAWFYSGRAVRREQWSHELLAIVKEKLGK